MAIFVFDELLANDLGFYKTKLIKKNLVTIHEKHASHVSIESSTVTCNLVCLSSNKLGPNDVSVLAETQYTNWHRISIKRQIIIKNFTKLFRLKSTTSISW